MGMISSEKVYYLDNNATTKVAPEVLQEMLPYFSEYYGNPSSAYTFGGQIEKQLISAKQKIADLIGAESENEIIFTSCGTESDNTAINAALQANPDKKHIITSKVEHPAILNYCEYLQNKGYEITFLDVDSKGQIDLNQLEQSITDNTAVVSLIWANNETGTVFPIKKISGIVKQKNVLFHTDAVQAVGKIDIDLKNLDIDFLSLSGHKLHAPKGVGVLYVKNKTDFKPYIIGGHQELGRRAGTENVASIIGLGKACESASKYMEFENNEVKKLRDKLENGLMQNINNIKINGDTENRLPNTTNMSFGYIEGEAILLYLNEFNICASSGSACTTGSLEPSHVLTAMNVGHDFLHGSIRFSLSRYNTEKEIDYVIEKLPDIVKKLRDMSPFGK